jgi:hypothetical protein
LWTLIGGSVLAMVIAVYRGAPQPPVPQPPAKHAHERPWLTHEAMEELVSPAGGPGPLFADLTLGGPVPARATRARVAAFARTNGIDIHLDVAGDELAAIRVGVTFGGCCGYEGADSFGRLLHRTNIYECDCRPTPADDWTSASNDGIGIHGHVAVNRVDVRWEAMLSLPEVLDRAEAIAGRPHATVRAHAGDHWHATAFDEVLELPFVSGPAGYGGDGLHLEVERGRITEVSFKLFDVASDELAATLRARWGRPHVTDGAWTWRTRERVITVNPDSFASTFVIHANAPASATAAAREAPRSARPS